MQNCSVYVNVWSSVLSDTHIFTFVNVRTHAVLEVHEIKWKTCLMSSDLPSHVNQHSGIFTFKSGVTLNGTFTLTKGVLLTVLVKAVRTVSVIMQSHTFIYVWVLKIYLSVPL